MFFLVLGAVNSFAQEFKRDIELRTFVPKGQWIVGSSVSYSEYSDNNYKFLIVDGFDADGYTFKVSPVALYAFRNNVAAGGRAAYSRTLTKVDRLSVNLDDENTFSLDDLYRLKHSYSGMAILRNYISIGNSTRFGLYNELQLTIGGGQTKLVSGKGESVTGNFETSRDFSIGLAPGMVAFVNNYTAVEVGIGVLGFNYSKTRQTTDQVYVGERSLNTANFKINIFSISLGIAFYL